MGTDRVGKSLQPVADEHEDIAHAAVLDLGEDVQPVLGSFTAVAGPQPEDLASALGGDCEGDVDDSAGQFMEEWRDFGVGRSMRCG